MDKADVIVIGSGQGGVPLAADLAGEGKRVVLFERGALGGSCVNYGCTPSKAFLAAAHAAGRARQADKLGIHASVRVDFGAVMERVRGIRSDFSGGVEKRLAKAGVMVNKRQAAFSGAHSVEGVEAPLIVINTGTSALIPKVTGLEGTPYLTNRTFFDLRDLPRRTIVLGGGYIGLELGQGLARLGSEVHLVHHHAHVLNQEEADVAEVLEESLRRDGVRMCLNCAVRTVEWDGTEFTVMLTGDHEIKADAFLVASGRRPNSDGMAVAKDDRGFVQVNERFETSVEGVYAIGDVARQPAFTHVSWEDYRRLKAILRGESRTRDDRVLAYAVYTEPQVGRVGLTLEQAQRKGYEARAVTMPMAHIARAIEWGQDLGFYRLVVDSKTDRILGATLVGYEAGELAHVILAHMQAGSTWRVLEQSVHIHPTYGEALPSLARLLVGS